MIRADIVTVYHNDTNYQQHLNLFQAIAAHEPAGGLRLIGVDNRTTNRGFAAACNLGAFHPDATAPVIGFVNPDVVVQGPFIDLARQALTDDVVITGNRFAKPKEELDQWGVTDWVCGATFFVTRSFFAETGGFDAQFTWGYEETDLIRQAETTGRRCHSVSLPLDHRSPTVDTPADVAYKRYHFSLAQRRYLAKWGRTRK